MPIDNDLYTRLAANWWDEDQPLAMLRTAMNPPRLRYFQQVLRRLHLDPRELAVLDVGCGGGFLAEEFARLGCAVTGVDPSAASLVTAQAHAEAAGLRITYREASGEDLPFADGAFNAVLCCDVLEHVRDLQQVVSEIGRVLAPGGVFLYDTVNRTLVGRIMLKLMQDWVRLAPPHLHEWAMCIKPDELRALLARHRLENQEVKGLRPSGSPVEMLRLVRRLKKGQLTYAELGRQTEMQPSRLRAMSYMGYAVKGA